MKPSINSKLADRSGVRLSYVPLLGQWCFRASGLTVQLPGEPTYFPTREATERAAVHAGLKVDCYGRVWPETHDMRTTR